MAFANTDENQEMKVHDNINGIKRRKGYDIDDTDLYKGNNKTIVSFYGFNFDYNTDTSDEENKYTNYKNKRFYRLRQKERNKHILKLWKIARIKATTCAVLTSIFNGVQTKVGYFGRNMVVNDKELKAKL